MSARTWIWLHRFANAEGCIYYLANSAVLRDLGGLVLQSPEGVLTTYDPMIQETDPRFGVDAALSAFDAAFETRAFFEKNDYLIQARIELRGKQ